MGGERQRAGYRMGWGILKSNQITGRVEHNESRKQKDAERKVKEGRRTRWGVGWARGLQGVIITKECFFLELRSNVVW